jgi:hypothetical protein
MSTASLENGNLTLGNLTINNSQYAEASGYVAAQTVISSSKTGTTLTTPIISGNIISAGEYNFAGSTENVYLNSASDNNVQLISNSPAGGLKIFNESGSVSLVPTSTNGLTLNPGGASSFTTSQITLGNVVLANPSTGNLTLNGPSSFTTNTVNTSLINMSSTVNLSSVGASNLTINNGGFSSFTTSQINLAGGVLSVNTSGQLLWNGVPIS